MIIADSIFLNNQDRYLSNCLSFSGYNLTLFNSTFINNTAIIDISIIELFLTNVTGLSDIAQLNPEIGGALSFEGVNMLINMSCFIANMGLEGGAIYVTSYALDVHQYVMISESYFKGNRGNVGGAIDFDINLQWIDAAIVFCVFVANSGKSKKIYIRFIIN